MDRTFAGIQIRQRQLGIDYINIFRRVYFTCYVDNVVVLEATHHVTDRFGFTDVGQELVTQTFTFGCTFHQARDVHELHGGWQNALRLHDFRKLVQTRVGHWHNAGVRLDGTEREVRRFDTRFGKRVKQGGFAHVWQTDDTAFESHF